MDPEFASNLRERVSAVISSPDGLFLEFIAEGSTFFFPRDNSWPDLRRRYVCVRETSATSSLGFRKSNKVTMYHRQRQSIKLP